MKKGKNLDAMAPSLMQLEDEPTLDLISRLQEAQIKEEGLKAEYSAKHPGLIAVRKQINHINKKIILNIRNLDDLKFLWRAGWKVLGHLADFRK